MGSIDETLARYKEDFDLFETPNEKFEYIFDLGKKHTTLPEGEKNDATFIEGCASPAWLVGECKDGKLILRGEGSSEMAKGMLTLLLDIFNNRTPDEILDFDPKKLNDLGIIEHLSPVRQKSLQAFLEKVYTYAKRCKEQNQ
ncbi:SufE family protein [Nitratifractor salsuginis]|uniref:Cysteine desulfuration protein SufE n=1 Tax=Nitratifractor salsuginis (strain DSM 16511 / JCM 12458 / E9I37-1) TaxID=749222 RepID=E6WYY7_NITSE|nr:SufE family protein [Nitratifractor salsuginis]ADV46573.1 Cysteine desulfuration protein SufE [Nitratifractor salsuginis DSM 16511]